MAVVSKFVYFFATVAVIVIMLCFSVFNYAFSEKYYTRDYEKRQTAQNVGISETELNYVTRNLISYMRGKSDTLSAYITVNGEIHPFYNQKEIEHMVDVRKLFETGFLIRNVCIGFLVLAAAFVIWQKGFVSAARVMLVSTIIILLGFAALVVVAALNFEQAFNTFHEIFFSNDLWQLDPNTDRLINIVPLEFFSDISRRIAIMFGVMLAVWIAALIAGLRVSKRFSNEY